MNYYDDKFREHVEMVACYCWLAAACLVIVLGALIGAGIMALWRQLFGG